MFNRIKALFTNPSKRWSRSEDLLHQAMVARNLMGAVRKAMESDATVLFEIHLPGGKHVFSLPGSHPGIPWLYDMAAGSWHSCLAESGKWLEREEQEAIREAEDRAQREKLGRDDCDYDR